MRSYIEFAQNYILGMENIVIDEFILHIFSWHDDDIVEKKTGRKSIIALENLED